MCAQTLGISYEDVLIAQPDTHKVPNSGPTVASRTAMIVGKLVERASQQMCAALVSSGHSLEGDFRVAALGYLAEHGALKASARYESPGDIFWDDDKYRGEAYPTYAWAVYVAEVAVDMTTYFPSVTEFHALQEVGKVLHPILAAGQIEAALRRASDMRSTRSASGRRATWPTTR